MARKRKPEEAPSGAPEWMTTYGDMVTLLLCFFVLLFSFSTVDAQKFQSLIQSFQGSSGILVTDGDAIISNDFVTEALKNNPTAAQVQELEDFQRLQEILQEYIESYELEAEILVTQEAAGLVLRFQDNVLFDSGKAILKPRSKEILNDISVFLEKPEFEDKFIRIEGHTDSDRIVSNSVYPTNWELSTGRSSNVVRYLIEDIGLEPGRFSASGYGKYHPVVPNDTIENKAKNRRVDIIILRSEYTTWKP